MRRRCHQKCRPPSKEDKLTQEASLEWSHSSRCISIRNSLINKTCGWWVIRCTLECRRIAVLCHSRHSLNSSSTTTKWVTRDLRRTHTEERASTVAVAWGIREALGGLSIRGTFLAPLRSRDTNLTQATVP